MRNNQKRALYENIIEEVAKIVKQSINEAEMNDFKSKLSFKKKAILESKHISNRMFFRALKLYGELERKELDEIFEDEPLMMPDDIHEVDSIYADIIVLNLVFSSETFNVS